jgi:hypothetical protein
MANLVRMANPVRAVSIRTVNQVVRRDKRRSCPACNRRRVRGSAVSRRSDSRLVVGRHRKVDFHILRAGISRSRE